MHLTHSLLLTDLLVSTKPQAKALGDVLVVGLIPDTEILKVHSSTDMQLTP